MTNKKDLKRTINYICSELFAECVAASLYEGKPDQSDVQSLLSTILKVHSDYIRRISHPEKGMPAKVFYKDLVTHFNKRVSEIIDQIGNLQ